jgi:hypothetical protein
MAEVLSDEEGAKELRALANMSGQKLAFEDIERRHEQHMTSVGMS